MKWIVIALFSFLSTLAVSQTEPMRMHIASYREYTLYLEMSSIEKKDGLRYAKTIQVFKNQNIDTIISISSYDCKKLIMNTKIQFEESNQFNLISTRRYKISSNNKAEIKAICKAIQ